MFCRYTEILDIDERRAGDLSEHPCKREAAQEDTSERHAVRQNLSKPSQLVDEPGPYSAIRRITLRKPQQHCQKANHAKSGEQPKDRARAVSNRSRTTAHAITIPAPLPSACRKRKTIKASILLLKAQNALVII